MRWPTCPQLIRAISPSVFVTFASLACVGSGLCLTALRAAASPAASPLQAPADDATQLSDTHAEHAQALESAKAARAEAALLVDRELERLAALQAQLRALRTRFSEARDDLRLRHDAVLGWQRRASDARAAGPAEADKIYDALRSALRAGRTDMADALDRLGSGRSEVPALGGDEVTELPAGVIAEPVRAARREAAAAIAAAREDERALRWASAASLLDEIDSLNRERLRLLSALSADKREAIVGLTASGWDQARSEAWHLLLLLRYHQHIMLAWSRAATPAGTPWSWPAAVIVVQLLILGGAFLWVRRRTATVLRWWEERLIQQERAERRNVPSLERRTTRILLKVHRPIEWLLFFVGSVWLLPPDARALLEVQLLTLCIGWSLTGAFIINGINALAEVRSADMSPFEDSEAGRLRLRSLRLVGRTIIGFALVLVLTAQLVGEGTIYRWGLSSCWFAAVPVFLVLVRWWSEMIFRRFERMRKRTPIQSWILANRAGWRSFLAAMLGAVQLTAAGLLKFAGAWLSGFVLMRRAHAYLFTRELERIGEGEAPGMRALSAALLQVLHPERRPGIWLANPNDEVLSAVDAAPADVGGQLLSVVGARGMGKSSLLGELAQRTGGSAVLQCRSEMQLSDIEAALRGPRDSAAPLVLLDDAHKLVQPCIGGFGLFDAVMALARSSRSTTWVFAIDSAMWPLIKRARDARPLFDQCCILKPWNETQLGELIDQRCQQAGIKPQYDYLLEKLPPGTDEIDRQDALTAKRFGYQRMLWAHVGGNPGLALEAWRVSLACDTAGVCYVRPLRVLPSSVLEGLPDPSLLILRAVLQLAPTSVEAVALATRLRVEEVRQDIRFGITHGFYEEQADHLRIAWPWLRAIWRLLERRHLLVTP